jgi:hypothetical protein
MAAVGSHNGNLPPKVLIWQAIATSDTASVWSYDCPVDSHKVVSSVNLASGAVCPRHHAVLTGEKTVDIT